MSNTLTQDNPGTTMLLMGNEAIVRGALEAGVTVTAAYPGTPSSEIGNTFSRIANESDIHFEWSSNEKVAMEVAFGASMCGQRTMVSMKHVGVNVALDILNPISLRGVDGGLVVISTDDPSQHSSRTEQDNRWIAKLNDIPVLEPSSPQEAKEFVKYAFQLSEKVRIPVMVRTVTRLSHMRSDVRLGEIDQIVRKPEFDWDGFSYRVAGFEKLFRRHKERHEKIEKVKEIFEDLDYNKCENLQDNKLGVIGVGFADTYVIDALKSIDLKQEIAHLKLVTPNPLPEKLVEDFITNLEEVVIFEEVDPFVELHVKALAKDVNPNLKILGRLNEALPREGELSHELVDSRVSNMLNKELMAIDRRGLEKEVKDQIFERMLTLCAGCPHRATLYALKKAVNEVKGDLNKVVVNGDIGCYGLAHAPPISFEDTYFCMGASIGVSQGMAQIGVDSIAWIGDGTFFHSGIPGLINSVVNKAPIKVVVADNETIAMTGFQTTPQSGVTATGEVTKKVYIEEIAKACGVEHIEVVDAYDLESAEEAFKKMLRHEGVAMVISRRLCATEAVRKMRPTRPDPFVIDESCVGCRICLNTYGCPALGWNAIENRAEIDTTLCFGCGVCAKICPVGSIMRS